MRILLTNSTDIYAGGEDYVLVLAKYLRRRHHDVVVSANPGHLLLRKCEDAGIATFPLAYIGMGRVFTVARQLRRAMISYDTEIVHSNANYDRTVAALAASFSPVPHIAGVHSAHSISHNITHRLRNRFGIDHFIADADAVRDVLVKEDGIAEERISVIPIGVEGGLDDASKAARERFRRDLGVDEETLVIGNVARLVPFKGHKVLLQAAAEVVKERRSVLFAVVGDGELAGELQQQAGSLGISQYMRWLGFRDNLNEIYPGFDIYCHSSLELAAEAFPIAILRALATGLPVVSTNVGGIRLMVEDGKSGFLTSPEQSHDLALALLKVIGNNGLRTSMGKASYELFRAKFYAQRMAEDVEEIYERELKKRKT